MPKLSEPSSGSSREYSGAPRAEAGSLEGRPRLSNAEEGASIAGSEVVRLEGGFCTAEHVCRVAWQAHRCRSWIQQHK